MAKSGLTRRQLLIGAGPAVAAVPLLAVALQDGSARAETMSAAEMEEHALLGHAAMIGDEAPAAGGPHDLDALLFPPEALPHEPGRVREYTLTAFDRESRSSRGSRSPPGHTTAPLPARSSAPRRTTSCA